MDIHSSNGQMPTRQVGMANLPEPQGFDILRVLWRWKFLPILGALIGLALGYLHYTRQPPQFMAAALVQVFSPIPPTTRVQPYKTEDTMQISRTDESLVISSNKVLQMAAQKLGKMEVVKDNLPEEYKSNIAAWIAGGRRLTVAPGAKDAGTTLISVSFVCDSQSLSANVVNAIVEAYSDYLSEEYETVGKEIYKLMTESQEKVSKSFVELRKKSHEAKSRIGSIVWTKDGAVNPFAANLQDVNHRLAGLAMERTTLASKLTQAKDALKNKRDPAAILLWLSESEYIERSLPQSRTGTPLDYTLANQQLESERMERQDLFRLKMEEQRFLNSVGESHPALASIRQQIDLVRRQISAVRESEKAQAAEVNEALQEKKKAENNEPSYKPLTAAERLAIRLHSLEEAQQSLIIQEQKLNALALTYEDQSKTLSKSIQDVELFESELQMVKSLQDAYLEKLKQIELGPTTSQRSLKELNMPTDGVFYGPKLTPYLLGGGAIGFLIMAGFAVLLDLADKSFRSPEDIAAELGAPVLGHIPAMEFDKLVKKPNQVVDSSICTIHHSKGRVSESYRSVRTGLFFSNRSGDLKVIQVTSPVPGDGKSTLSANLAVTMAQSGRRVLLIDADFRRPRIAKLFGIDSDKGMATAVAGACELDEAVHESSVPFLSIMPGGKRPSNPAELLSSQRFADLLEVLRGKFDMIVVDTPPLLAVSDPSAVAAIVDGVVLTMRLRRNVKPLVSRAHKILESVDANILGIVVNGVSQEAGYGYNYGYRDYRYAYQYRYGYGYKGYNYRGGYGYGKKYLEEAHDIDTDHVLLDNKDAFNQES